MSENTRKFAVDYATLDAKVVAEDDNSLTMQAVIAREIVHKYDDGMAYKPAEELEAAAWTAEGRHVKILEHPETGLLQRREDVYGRILDAKFVKDLKDPKTNRPCGRGIKATLKWDKRKVPENVIGDIKKGALRDVSIGFTYNEDATPGEWNGQHYDYVQRDIFIDHVVAPCELGRCPSPYCGIAVDSIIKNVGRKIAGDPWEVTEEYVRSGHREVPETHQCRTIIISEDEGIKAILCKYGDSWEIQSYLFDKDKWTVERAKAWFSKHKGDTVDYLTKLYKCHTCRDADQMEGNINWVRSMENAKKLGYSMDAVLIAKDAGTPKTDEERAKAHFGLSDAEWNALSEEKKKEYISKLPPAGSKRKKENETSPPPQHKKPVKDNTPEQIIAETDKIIALHDRLKRE